jgi:hypothetical protein
MTGLAVINSGRAAPFSLTTAKGSGSEPLAVAYNLCHPGQRLQEAPILCLAAVVILKKAKSKTLTGLLPTRLLGRLVKEKDSPVRD